MTRLTRRTALYGLGSGGLAALAGCAREAGPGTGDGDDGAPETEVHQVGGALSGPAWNREERRGFCALFAEESDAAWLLRDAPAEARAFAEETDFEASALAYVESVGPTTCHSGIAFADVAVEDGTLVASAAVRGPGDDDVACGQAITFSGAFLRVTADARPDAIRVSVTDGWGETSEVTGGDGVLDPGALPGGVRPDDEPEALPAAFECDAEGFERHPQVYEGAVNWGSGGGAGDDGDGPLALRAVIPGDDGPASEPLSIGRGTRFRIELTNVSGRGAYVGNQGKYNLELRTETGWTEIRGAEEGATFEYTDEALGVRPGETLTWEFEMTESGLIEGGPHADVLRVCPDLVPGRYRFVFWGAADIAVAFDYVG